MDGRRVLNFCSNNYLGLANHPHLVAAAHAALDRYGVGPGAVRTIAGTMTLHDELEERLARFKGVPAAISLQSGFAANLGTIAALVGEGDAVISDELNHASIVDGVRLTRAARSDLPPLPTPPTSSGPSTKPAPRGRQRILVITDGVFSMDGDIAPLDAVVAVAEPHEALVMVDDAHGEGVLGRGGRGIVDHFGLHGRVDVEVGTMSKAFGVMGGYVAGSLPWWSGAGDVAAHDPEGLGHGPDLDVQPQCSPKWSTMPQPHQRASPWASSTITRAPWGSATATMASRGRCRRPWRTRRR